MNNFIGSDLERMTQLETNLVRQADIVAQINGSVDQQIQQLTALWRGPDSQSFTAEWTAGHRLRMHAAETALRQAAETVQRNRIEQHNTSESFDGGGFSAGGMLGSLVPIFGAGGALVRGASWVGNIDLGDYSPFLNNPSFPFGPVQDLFGERSTSVSGGAEYTLFERSREVSGSRFGGHYYAEGSIDGSASVSGEAHAGIGPDGAEVTASAEASAGLSAEAKAGFIAGGLGVGGVATGFAGAKADAKGSASIGPDGAEVGVEAGGFAGVRGTAEGEVSLGDSVTVGGNAEAIAGLALEVDGSAKVGFDEVSVALDLGAALGVGGSLGVDVSFSPSGIANDVGDLASSTTDAVIGGAGSLLDGTGSLIGKAFPF